MAKCDNYSDSLCFLTLFFLPFMFQYINLGRTAAILMLITLLYTHLNDIGNCFIHTTSTNTGNEFSPIFKNSEYWQPLQGAVPQYHCFISTMMKASVVKYDDVVLAIIGKLLVKVLKKSLKPFRCHWSVQ